jgi:hypothetical protein
MALAALLGAQAHAAADPAALVRSFLPPGFSPSALEVPTVPLAAPIDMQQQTAAETKVVTLPPLLGRHLSRTDAFTGAGGVNLIGGTLAGNGDGYLAVTPPGGQTRYFKIEPGMTGNWSDGARTYRVSLSVNIFRPAFSNYIQIRDTATGQLVWNKRIGELFRLTYRVGEPVHLAGRPYRLFYSELPTLGLCFIYDDMSGGGNDYKFYLVPMEQVRGLKPASYRMFRGDVVYLRVSPDLSTLHITR